MLENYFEYPAACTRTRGVRSKLLTETDWKNLTQSRDLFSALNFLVETEYRGFFEWTTLHADALPSLRRVEHTLRASTVSYIINILRFLSGAPAEALTVLIQKYELLNIKKTIRKLNQSERRENHLEINNYDLGRYSLCKNINWDDIKSQDELSEILKPTYYRYAYMKGQNLIEQGRNLMFFECMLEKVYYEQLISSIVKLEKNKSDSIRALIADYLDEVSLTTFVRLKYNHQLDYSTILPLLPLSGCRKITEQLLNKLSAASSMEDFFSMLAEDSNCKKTAGETLKKTIFNMRKLRERHCVKIFAEGLSLNIAPAVAFYFLKEQEVEDLISLLQCKRFNIEINNKLMCVNF
ncbi:MAG: hypothetical protein DRI44_07600 [Chlamydiae bacterium]|nr:MAG: hypothetical protein DRI44_07600 [Chlamydiota bacterium]